MIKKLGFLIFSKLRILSFYSLKRSGYLKDKGWFNSFQSKQAVDANRNPVPWMTYCFVDFLKPRLKLHLSVYEYGCGNSSIWWSRHVNRVVSCEHDVKWYEEMSKKIPGNVSLKKRNLDEGEYANSINEESTFYDIVVIDGEDRINCAKSSLKNLSNEGVIIWDNSDRPEYQKGYDHLRDYGFKRLDFYGIGPINVVAWSTTVFYRENNCLGI